MLLGYNAAELNRLVTQCAERKLQRVRETLRPGIIERLGSGTKTITIAAAQNMHTLE